MKVWADAVDKKCFGRVVPKNLGVGVDFRPCSNQIYLVMFKPTQLTQASFFTKKNQMMQNVFF